jgi:hypothetical protein
MPGASSATSSISLLMYRWAHQGPSAPSLTTFRRAARPTGTDGISLVPDL